MSQISESQLESGLDQLHRRKQQGFGLAEGIDPFVYERKSRTRPTNWDEYPLESVDGVRRWWQDRETRFRLGADGGRSESRTGAAEEDTDEVNEEPEGGPAEGDAEELDDMVPTRSEATGTTLGATGGAAAISPGSVPTQERLVSNSRRAELQQDEREDAYIW